MNAPYLLFAGEDYYPAGGIKDFVFRGTLGECLRCFVSRKSKYFDTWGQIVEAETLRLAMTASRRARDEKVVWDLSRCHPGDLLNLTAAKALVKTEVYYRWNIASFTDPGKRIEPTSFMTEEDALLIDPTATPIIGSREERQVYEEGDVVPSNTKPF